MSAEFRQRHMRVIELNENDVASHTISLGWGHKVCWKKLDVVFNRAPSGK